MNLLRMEGKATIDAAASEAKRIDRELDRLVDVILKGGAAERINKTMVGLEARKRELENVLANADEPPPAFAPRNGRVLPATSREVACVAARRD